MVVFDHLRSGNESHHVGFQTYEFTSLFRYRCGKNTNKRGHGVSTCDQKQRTVTGKENTLTLMTIFTRSAKAAAAVPRG